MYSLINVTIGLPEIALLKELSSSKYFFTPTDPYGDYGYCTFRVHKGVKRWERER
jgi:hypothetical protein